VKFVVISFLSSDLSREEVAYKMISLMMIRISLI